MACKSPFEPIRAAARPIQGAAGPVSLRHLAGQSGIAILESVASGGDGRYSILAGDPVASIRLHQNDGRDPFDVLAETMRPWHGIVDAHDLPFVGGWIGYLSYESARWIEPTAGWRDHDMGDKGSDLPLMQWTLYDTVIVHDIHEDTTWVAGVELPERLAPHPRQPLEERLSRMENLARRVRPEPIDSRQENVAPHHWWTLSRAEYLARVERALAYIRAGDIFQVNLARKCHLPTTASPAEVFSRLCRHNPAAYAAYLPIESDSQPAAVISSSPELFLRLENGRVTTRPIKGTRPRFPEPEHDRGAAHELATSEKDRAELNMIIDLERNDLGRVCAFGSIRVEDEGAIEALPTVFHRTATITGRLEAEADALDLLRATFPGGSITGAPKVRAMQIINELEPGARGPYCGAIGFIGLDGNMTLNLPIRTLTLSRSAISLMVGSGIVADSVPEEELRELDAKAAGMLAALGIEITEQTPGRSVEPATL